MAADRSVKRMSWPSLRTVHDDLLGLVHSPPILPLFTFDNGPQIINFCLDATRELEMRT